jgi:hypothetical protein
MLYPSLKGCDLLGLQSKLDLALEPSCRRARLKLRQTEFLYDIYKWLYRLFTALETLKDRH